MAVFSLTTYTLLGTTPYLQFSQMCEREGWWYWRGNLLCSSLPFITI